MAISVLQEKTTENNSTGLTTSVTLNSPVTVGSWLEAIVYCDNGSGSVWVSDTLNGSYSERTRANDAHDSNFIILFNIGPSFGGANTVTVTRSPGLAAPLNLIVREIGNCSGYDNAATALYQIHPGTTGDAIFCNALTPSVQPGLITATSVDGTFLSTTMVVGTGFSAGSTNQTWVTAQGMLSENQRYTALTPIQATATDGTRGTLDWFATIAALYKEGTPLMPARGWETVRQLYVMP
jgi:hypothetical protein